MNVDSGLVELLEKLVSIPSVNPAHTDDVSVTGEQRMAEFTAAFLEEIGFAVEWDTEVEGRPNLVARCGGAAASKTLLVEAHTDTVSEKGMTKPFSPHVKDGRLYGRGACDTKGPMAAALWALKQVGGDVIRSSSCEIVFVAAMGEETGNDGAEYLVAKGLGADQAIILEPTELSLVVAHKGALWLKVDMEGTPGHGSNPEEGLSAIMGAAEFLRLLQNRVEQDQMHHTHALLGRPTLNVGRIDGGSAVNIIPGTCVVEIDRRTLPDENHEQIIEVFRGHLESLVEQGYLKSYRIGSVKNRGSFATDEKADLVARMKVALEAVGEPPAIAGSAWYSDAGIFAATCREVVVFGPGSISQAHTRDEYIELDSLQKGCDVLRRFFQELVEPAKA